MLYTRLLCNSLSRLEAEALQRKDPHSLNTLHTMVQCQVVNKGGGAQNRTPILTDFRLRLETICFHSEVQDTLVSMTLNL